MVWIALVPPGRLEMSQNYYDASLQTAFCKKPCKRPVMEKDRQINELRATGVSIFVEGGVGCCYKKQSQNCDSCCYRVLGS